MATIYKGERRLSQKEIKSEIKRIRGWSETRYQKELKNVRRGLTRYENQFGKTVSEKTPTEFLYTEAKSRERYKSDYVQSQYVKDVRRLGTISKQRTILTTRGQIKQLKQQSVDTRFNGLIQTNSQAREIAQKIKDPFKREKALSDFANKIHAKIDKAEKVKENQAIPFSSQTYGSDTTIDFDIDKYL